MKMEELWLNIEMEDRSYGQMVRKYWLEYEFSDECCIRLRLYENRVTKRKK